MPTKPLSIRSRRTSPRFDGRSRGWRDGRVVKRPWPPRRAGVPSRLADPEKGVAGPGGDMIVNILLLGLGTQDWVCAPVAAKDLAYRRPHCSTKARLRDPSPGPSRGYRRDWPLGCCCSAQDVEQMNKYLVPVNFLYADCANLESSWPPPARVRSPDSESPTR